jgi:hypothetical protein
MKRGSCKFLKTGAGDGLEPATSSLGMYRRLNALVVQADAVTAVEEDQAAFRISTIRELMQLPQNVPRVARCVPPETLHTEVRIRVQLLNIEKAVANR